MAGLDLDTYSIDFFILDTNDPKTILLLDRSNYLFEPERPQIRITPPGYTGYLTVEYPGVKNSIVELNSDSISLTTTCDYDVPFMDLPDGVYQITMMVCPYDELYNKKCFLKTTQLDCKIQEILLMFDDCDCVENKEFKKNIIDVDILLQSARAEVNICSTDRATEKYRQALKIVNSLFKKVNCK